MAIQKLPSTGDAPRSTGVPTSLVAGGAGDSAGLPWEGRTFDHHGTDFADDDGSTPTQLREAVASVRSAAKAHDLEALANTHAAVVVALSQSRLLIPLVAEAGDIGLTPEGRTVEKTQELSIVTVAAPDGRRVMPVFTSVETMRAWNPEARPIPVPGPQVAIAAAQEITDLLIVDAATAEYEFGVRRPALQAMATGEHILPAWCDDDVQQAFDDSCREEPQVAEIKLMPGDPEARLLSAEVDVVVLLSEVIDRQALEALLGRMQHRWTRSEVITARVDSMRVVPRAASEAAARNATDG